MPKTERLHKMTIRLSDDEAKLRDLLEAHLGSDGSGVMRQGLLKLARDENIVLPPSKNQPPPKTKPKSR